MKVVRYSRRVSALEHLCTCIVGEYHVPGRCFSNIYNNIYVPWVCVTRDKNHRERKKKEKKKEGQYIVEDAASHNEINIKMTTGRNPG